MPAWLQSPQDRVFSKKVSLVSSIASYCGGDRISYSVLSQDGLVVRGGSLTEGRQTVSGSDLDSLPQCSL